MTPIQFRGGFVALLLAASLSTACKKADKTPPGADSSATMDRPAALQVASVDLGKAINADKKVTTSIDDFGVRDTIYASVATTGSGNGVLVANWTFEDGQQVERSEQNVSASGPAVTEFHIAKPSGWPAGKYQVEISTPAGVLGTKAFEVH
jgi:hypothetical protein